MNSEDRKKLLDNLSNVKLGFIGSEQDKYFREKLKKLSSSDYNDLMRRYIRKTAIEGFIDVDEFDKAIDELLRRETPLGEKEEKNMPLAKNEKFVYKKNVSTNEFVKVGVVDNCGYVEFYDTDKKVEVNSLGLYFPEFYTDFETIRIVKAEFPRFNDKGEKCGTYMKDVGSYVPSIDKEVFVPKNLPQQTISLVDSIFLQPEEYNVTGYVTREGRVYYYDQYREV